MATLTNLIAQVRYRLEDSAGTYITDAEITAILNEGLLDLAAREGILQAETSSTTSGNTIALPATFISAISLRLGTDDVQFVDDETWWGYSDDGATPEVTLGRVFNENIELYPTPTTGTAYKLRYTKKPTALSAGSDVPAIPEEMHVKLVYYALSILRLKEGFEGHADRYEAKYRDGLRPLATRQRIIPGPLTISMEPGPFDTSEAAHI